MELNLKRREFLAILAAATWLGNESEELKVDLVIESQKCNGNQQQGQDSGRQQP